MGTFLYAHDLAMDLYLFFFVCDNFYYMFWNKHESIKKEAWITCKQDICIIKLYFWKKYIFYTFYIMFTNLKLNNSY